jgi:anti-sigma-K factor RskA
MSEHISSEDKDLLAAQYAMGLAEGRDLTLAERLIETDSEFVMMHGRWRERLSAIDSTVPAQPASEALWQRIAQSVAPLQSASKLAPSASATMAQKLVGYWNSLGFWRPAGLVAALASLVLAVGLGFAMREVSRQPILVAVLMTDANQPGAIVNVHADGRAELVPLGDIPVPAGRALQIWTLWDRVRGPVSVGLSRSARRLDLDVKALPRTVPTQLFEITLEPEAGSPTGRPTGPILMKGNATTAL